MASAPEPSMWAGSITDYGRTSDEADTAPLPGDEAHQEDNELQAE